jgi:hypothetical protein
VQKYWLDKGASGYSVFKFQLKRQPGQPELGLKAVQFIGREQKHLQFVKVFALRTFLEAKRENAFVQ